MVLDNPGALWLLPVLPLLLAGLWLLGWRTKSEAAGILRLDVSRLKARLLEKYVLAWLVMTCLTVAWSMPKIPNVIAEVPKKAGEIALLVDVSASMAAQVDLSSPNRLERAKSILNKLVDSMDADEEVRLSLHGVTTIARSLVPFVSREDYPYLRESVKRVLGIHSVPGSGTSLGRPISNVVGKFSQGEQARLIILLSDGEASIGQTPGIQDVERGWIADAVASATSHGVKVITVGVGEPGGAKIPYSDEGGYIGEFAKLNDVDFVSHLREDVLQEIAAQTGGRYFRETDQDELVEYVEASLRTVSTTAAEREIRTYRPAGLWFTLAALAIWVVFARRHLLS